MTNNICIKKYRNHCNTGTVYNLIWRTRIDDEPQYETIRTDDSNPISEDYIKHMLVTMAAHKNIDALISAIAESLPVQED